MQIQEIIRGKKGKLTVRLEGGLSFPIYEKEAAKYRMTEGGSLSDQEWNEICTEILEFFFSCQAPDGSYHAAVDYSDPENEDYLIEFDITPEYCRWFLEVAAELNH